MWLAVAYRTANASCLAPTITGWETVVTPASGAGWRLGMYFKQGDGGAGSAIITWNVPVVPAAIIALVDGSHTVTPVNAFATATTIGSALGLHSINGVTTTVADCLLFGAWAGSSPGYWENHSIFGIGPDERGVVDVSYYFTTSGMPESVGVIAPDKWWFNPDGTPLSVGIDIAGSAGGTGARIAVSDNISQPLEAEAGALIALIAIAPYQGPSRPTLTAPVDSETITLGRTYNLTWTASTDPTVAQSSLTYNIDYSTNDGGTWTQIVANTSAGAVTYPWNTTGLPATPQAKIRIRAHNGTEFSSYYTTGRFTLATDVAPNAPINMHGEQPDGTTVTLFDRTLTLLVKGTFSDLGDVMTGYQLDWGTDGITYGTASGTITSSVLSHSFPGATFSSGTVYFRARTKDTAGTFGPYTFFTLTAATPPAAPNITAPTAGSPPNAPFPTISWTSTGQVSYRITITSGGATKYAGAFVASSATSVTSPFAFLNDTEYTLTIVYKDSSGLTSPSDSETFTVSFLGPATPTIIVT